MGRRLSDRRLATQCAVSRVLADAASLDEAAQDLLEAIGRGLGWPLAVLWYLDRGANVLRVRTNWHDASVAAAAAALGSAQSALPAGAGLPGRAWAAGEPLWVPNILEDADLPRLRVAAEVGLRGALAVPIRDAGGTLGVIELFNHEVRAPAEGLLATVATIGNQLGQFMERKRAEEALRRWAHVFEHARWGVALLSADGTTLEALNRAFADMHRYTVEELVGRPMVEMFAPTERDKLSVANRRAREERHYAWETTHVRKDGTVFPVLVDLTAVQGDDGSVLYYAVNVQDLTERKLAEDELRQALKMEAVGRLAGGVAHEVNNMMMVIRTCCEFLSESIAPEDTRWSDVEEISRAADRAAAVTRQLLAFSRRQRLEPRVQSLSAIVHGMETMLERLLGEHIQLKTAVSADVGAVNVDRGQLEQVIVNLALNARDAMPSGGELTVETQRVYLPQDLPDRRPGITIQSGPYVMLAVSDTGVGMSGEVLSRAFEPFFTTKPAGQGSGLGLATAYGIVKQSNGYILAYSEPGRGTTFRIYLPEVPNVVEARQAGAAPLDAPRGDETILVVEDESAVRRLAVRSLEALGYSVLQARHGAEALRSIAQHSGPVHLVVTDVIMPEMGGRELARRLGELYPDVAVIFTSGYTNGEIMRQGVLGPRDPFLQKPFSREAFARKVREVLDAKGAARRAGTADRAVGVMP